MNALTIEGLMNTILRPMLILRPQSAPVADPPRKPIRTAMLLRRKDAPIEAFR